VARRLRPRARERRRRRRRSNAGLPALPIPRHSEVIWEI